MILVDGGQGIEIQHAQQVGDPLHAQSRAKEDGEELALADETGDLPVLDGLAGEYRIHELLAGVGQLVLQLGPCLCLGHPHAVGG